MLEIIISWIYIGLVCILLGTGLLEVANRITGKEANGRKPAFSMIDAVMAGILGITVYVEIWSLFGRIQMLAQLVLLAGCMGGAFLGRKKLQELAKQSKKILFSWEGFFYLCFVVFLAFFASRGEFHTDTNIYHAQAIRMYEEYGVLKGSGNLQQHYGYNSAGLAFASIFSFNWLLGHSVHSTTGFLEVVMCIYAFHGLKTFSQHRRHTADMMRIAILFYALIILVRTMSPATDYATMFLVLYVLTAWCENMEGEKSITRYSLLSVFAVLVMTYKFSACMLVLLAIYPAFYLIKGRKWKQIGLYVISGMVILLPFLLRNYLISGWLLYPFGGIDLFHPVWKVPKEYLMVDSRQITVWGRCLYDITQIDKPMKEWLPVWWSEKERYEQMFLGAQVLGIILLAAQFVMRRIRKEKWRGDFAAFLLAIFANLVVWFRMAPFIRYGQVFLLAVPLIAAGEWLDDRKKGFYSILCGSLVFGLVITVSAYWEPYITYAGVFVKQNYTSPYYVWQQEYDRGEVDSLEINGNTVYYNSGSEEINSYYYFPNTCYPHMLERSTLIGNTIEEGFRAK